MNFAVQWGKSISINLFDCDRKKLTDPDALKTFIRHVIKSIHMVAHGPCYIERFGIGKLAGYSAMQFIETSSITVHCDEVGNRAFIDIFSCKDFDAEKAKNISIKFFHAKRASSVTLDR
jgi:S-adenosylmethionine/arginine decarboxylase-like enzyme